MGLQLCASEGSDSFDYDWNPIMQTIVVLSCLLAATSSLYLYHPAPLLVHPSSGYGLNQAHPLLIHHGLPLAHHTGYPNWPGVRALGFSSTCYGCRGKRSAEPYRVPLLAAYHHPVPLPFVHHLVPTATGEVTESGAGYEVKQTHGLHASSFQSVTRGAAEPAAEEQAEA